MADTPQTINVGTRRSALALVQAELVVAALRAAHPTINFVIQARDTMGDIDKITPLPNLGKGLWTSEFEAKLVSNELDIVVHCAKDMPTSLPEGCALGVILEREDPRDVVIFKESDRERYKGLRDLPDGAVVGTSSVRRMAQLRRRYPKLRFRDLRGNIDTRMRKLDESPKVEEANESGRGPAHYDCIILAAAGLLRTGVGARISQFLESTTEGGGILHAVGQGALAIEVREGDERVMGLLEAIADEPTHLAVLAERAVMRALEGGCSVPIGVETKWEGEKLRLRGTVVSLDGTVAVDADSVEVVKSKEEADAFGKRVAEKLVELGAQKILDEINKDRSAATTA